MPGVPLGLDRERGETGALALVATQALPSSATHERTARLKDGEIVCTKMYRVANSRTLSEQGTGKLRG